MYQKLLEDIVTECGALSNEGKVASYIPELSNADPNMLGIGIALADGRSYHAGDSLHRFTIQSISKMLIFTCSLMDNKMEQVLKKISLEPTAENFDSIASLETKNFNKPLNPMINAGAIAGLTLVKGHTPNEKFKRVLALAKIISGNPNITFNKQVYLSEKNTGSRNRSLAYYMKSTGIIDDEVEPLLDAYFRICSIEMNCTELASTALSYAQNGALSNLNKPLFSKEIARTVKAVISLCGMYNESGSVAIQVGLPSKSGVGGGILSLAPDKMGIGIFSPALNDIGTSVAGLAALKRLSQELDLSIY